MGRVSLYYFIVLLTFLYIILKNRSSSLKVLIILCFYSGLAAFYGKTIENPFKIIVVILSIYILLKYNGLYGLNRGQNFLLIIFVLFSVSFLYSAIVNGDYFNLTFSQYGKYVTPICFLFVFQRLITKSPERILSLNKLFFNLLTIQIILSIVKIPTIGLQETVVGSMAYLGGGQAAMVPVLGFILVWLHKQGNINRKDWIYIALLLFIGFASLKRAIWFIMPVTIFLFLYYVPRKLKISHLIYFLPLIPLVFYVGVRLSPTLNKEGKIWGTFDLQYSLDYVQKYSFGKTSNTSDIQLGTGRGGATLLLWKKLFNSQPLSGNDYWGTGLREVYTTDYEQFNDSKYGTNSKGSVTGVFQSYISSGYIGVMVTILLIISIIGLIKEPRIRITIMLLMFWDYFFYSSLILKTQALLILFFFVIIYSNLQYEQKLYRKYLNRKPDDKNRNLQPRSV
jgi:hypothetical protein